MYQNCTEQHKQVSRGGTHHTCTFAQTPSRFHPSYHSHVPHSRAERENNPSVWSQKPGNTVSTGTEQNTGRERVGYDSKHKYSKHSCLPSFEQSLQRRTPPTAEASHTYTYLRLHVIPKNKHQLKTHTTAKTYTYLQQKRINTRW